MFFKKRLKDVKGYVKRDCFIDHTKNSMDFFERMVILREVPEVVPVEVVEKHFGQFKVRFVVEKENEGLNGFLLDMVTFYHYSFAEKWVNEKDYHLFRSTKEDVSESFNDLYRKHDRVKERIECQSTGLSKLEGMIVHVLDDLTRYKETKPPKTNLARLLSRIEKLENVVLDMGKEVIANKFNLPDLNCRSDVSLKNTRRRKK